MTNSHGQETSRASVRLGVIGATGQLGRCLVRAIEQAPDLELAFATRRDQVDLADVDGLAKAVARCLDDAPRLDVVINAAAHTGVDACESEPALAYQVNALAPAEWARQTRARSVRFLHVSTDYVFEGRAERPYREDDPSAPCTVYGSSKRAGEVAVLGTDPGALIVRTSWVFGPGRNFVVTMLEQAAKRLRGEQSGPLRVVNDQHGCPTLAADLADAMLDLVRRDVDPDRPRAEGLLHLCNGGSTTWFEFARAIFDRAGLGEIAVEPVPTSAYPTPAPRPPWSVLDCERARALGLAMPEWPDALSRYLAGPDRPAVLEDVARRSAPPVHEVSR